METWVALLYSVVLGGGRRLTGAGLRDMAGALGLRAPRTLVATGNLVFAADGDAAALGRRLEAEVAARFGRPIPVFVRAAADWRRTVATCPFRAEADAAPASAHLRVMRAPPAAEAIAALEARRAGRERIAVVDGDLWLWLPDGFAGSRLAAAAGAARVGAGTFRNWNTVRGLERLLDA